MITQRGVRLDRARLLLIQFPDTFGNRRLGKSGRNNSTDAQDCLFFIFRTAMNSTCDLANANTMTPANLVNVMPDNTLLPVIDKASQARWWFDPDAHVNALTMCDTNSTPMPIHCGWSNREWERKWLSWCLINTNCKTYHNQIDQRNGIQWNVPHPHQAAHVH